MSSNNGPRRPRQLLVGLDAMEWRLVARWANEGKLPTFRRLMEQGMRAELKSAAAQLPDTVWPCIYTGSNPATFQKYFYVQYDPATHGLKHVADDGYKATPFWERLSDAGVSVGVVDVPKFPASKSINGYQVANWGAHATRAARTANPPELWAEVMKRFGEFPVRDCDAVDDRPGPMDELRRNVIEGVRKHGRLFRWLMRDRPADVFFGAFSAPHCIGHHFRRFQDPVHPRYDPKNKHGFATAMEDTYRAIDSEIGEMLHAAGPDARVLAFAGHGMGPVHHASWNIPDILNLLGYGAPGAQVKPRKGRQEERDASVSFWRILEMVMPGKAQYALKSMLPRAIQDQLLFLWYSGGQNWRGAKAFAVPNNDAVGSIRIAVRGRDRFGLVEPGREYDTICRDLRDAFEELVDPVSGRNVVKKVTITQQEFEGPHIGLLPDVTMLWDASFPWSAIRSPRIGTLRIRRQDGRTGSHTEHGFLLAAGPGVPAGVEVSGRSLYDIAPTVLEAAGVPRPESMDGQPLPITKAMTA